MGGAEGATRRGPVCHLHGTRGWRSRFDARGHNHPRNCDQSGRGGLLDRQDAGRPRDGLSDFAALELRKAGKSVKKGTKVNVLCRLGLVADWVEEGLISRDVRNFLPFDDENGTTIGTDGETAQASSLVQTYPRSGVDQWPVLGSLSTVVTAGSVACVLSFVVLLYNRRWLQRAPNFDDAVTPEAGELLETQA